MNDFKLMFLYKRAIFVNKKTLYICKEYGDLIMNLALRKLALLENEMAQKEETARIQGFVTSPIDTDLKRRVTMLMDRVRSF